MRPKLDPICTTQHSRNILLRDKSPVPKGQVKPRHNTVLSSAPHGTSTLRKWHSSELSFVPWVVTKRYTSCSVPTRSLQ